MSGLGIIAGGLRGGADAVVDITKGYIEKENRADLAKVQADLEMQKQKAAEDYKYQRADQDRAARADRINGSAGIVEQEMQQRLADKHAPLGGVGPVQPADDIQLSPAEKARARLEGAARTQDLPIEREAQLASAEDRVRSAERRAELAEAGRNARTERTETGKDGRAADREAGRDADRDQRAEQFESREARIERLAKEKVEAAGPRGKDGKISAEKATTVQRAADLTIKNLNEQGRPRDPAQRQQWDDDMALAQATRREAMQSIGASRASAPAPAAAPAPDAPKKTGGSASLSSAEAVRDAYRSGKLSREEAKQKLAAFGIR